MATVRVWVPLVWNHRFLGTAGIGNRLTAGFVPENSLRIVTLATAVRNGFAAASTDGAVGADPRFSDWQLNERTKEIDEDLVDNWVHRSTHEMTLIGKAVTTAIQGTAPQFSYFQGGSGGGRQAMASAIHHPSDYNGIWSDVPAINWTRTIPAELWPSLVMKELGNPLPPAKLEAFRQAAVADYNRTHYRTEPFITSTRPHDFDPHQIIGQDTGHGVITELDAVVMKMIWDGPRSADGQQLWFGLRPGVESWGWSGSAGGLCRTSEDTEGNLTPEPFPVAHSWFRTWLLRDPDWDWTNLTFDEYAHLFAMGVEKFSRAAVDDPDLSAFRDAGAKLLITHGTDDQVVFSQGTCHYFDRVLRQMGGYTATSKFARFFLCHGDGHGFPTATKSYGTDLATGMIALMNWVENGIAPASLELLHFTPGNSVADTAVAHPYGQESCTGPPFPESQREP
ncbi:tannase/feruloyl esterase family alpha/beta hydrolase [Corynebacterium lemuris]|uniref:tannase/feruloyl esterase family alpha/beta hydrolase n=1 Tax=Corynebacterium lemuris TaxID=1859292 RepID=UPI003F727DE3